MGSYLTINSIFDRYLPLAPFVLFYGSVLFAACSLPLFGCWTRSMLRNGFFLALWLVASLSSWFRHHLCALFHAMSGLLLVPLSFFGSGHASPVCCWFLEWSLLYLSPYAFGYYFSNLSSPFGLSCWYLSCCCGTIYNIFTRARPDAESML